MEIYTGKIILLVVVTLSSGNYRQEDLLTDSPIGKRLERILEADCIDYLYCIIDHFADVVSIELYHPDGFGAAVARAPFSLQLNIPLS